MLDRWLGAVLWLWNTALEIRSAAYRQLGLRLNGNDISRWLTQWKRTKGHEWLQDVPATVLTQTLRDQDQAFRNFFGVKKDGTKRKAEAGYPKPKNRWGRKSLRFQDIGKAWEQGILSLPNLGR
jgi:putative transposase